MENTLKEFELKIKQFEMPEMLVMSGLGLALVLFGYRIKKIAFFIIWFLIGYNLMLILMPWIGTFAPEVVNTELYQILLPIGGGALLALLGFSIEKFCVSAICFALVMLITVQYFGTDVTTLAIGGVVGLVAGALATKLMKPAVIIATSLAGGWTLTLAILTFFPGLSSEIFYFPLIVGITVIGVLFQFKTTEHIS